MMIAGGHVFLSRSLAIARSLFHIHCVGLGCAPFSSAHSFVVPSGEGGGDDGVAVLRFAHRLVLRFVFSSRIMCPLFDVHSCRSKQETAFSSITAPSLSRAPLCQILRSLPRCPFRLVPRPVLRLVVRLVSCRLALSLRSHPVSSCPMYCMLAAAPFCSAHLVVIFPCHAALIAS